MSKKSVATAVLVLAFAAGCASAPPKQVRSEFEDIPVPKGLSYQADKSTIIESPTVKAARLVYRGRLEVDSLASAMRTTLEANGVRLEPGARAEFGSACELVKFINMANDRLVKCQLHEIPAPNLVWHLAQAC